MSRKEAVARLVKLREMRRRQAMDGSGVRKIRDVIRDQRSLDQSFSAAFVAQMNASAALDREALTIAIVALLEQEAGS